MKKKHYLLFLLALLFLLTDVVWAQTSATVSGVVIDENGETLPGVSVVEVGTTNGVLTDLNGHYTLKTTSAKPSVSFSYIGYQTTTLLLNGRTKLDVQMKVETKVLDEVVVVDYKICNFITYWFTVTYNVYQRAVLNLVSFWYHYITFVIISLNFISYIFLLYF